MEIVYKRILSHNKAGGEVYLLCSQGEEFEYSIRYLFPATNNVVEYEAWLTGLDLARKIRIGSLKVHVNSKLVAKKVMKEY